MNIKKKKKLRTGIIRNINIFFGIINFNIGSYNIMFIIIAFLEAITTIN